MKILLAGEKPTELGSWAKEPAYRGGGTHGRRHRARSADHEEDGVVIALLGRCAEGRHEVVGARLWKSVRKYRAGDHRRSEERTVLGLALHAREIGCDALVFVRDRDGDPKREEGIERGLTEAATQFETIKIIGGVAIEAIESWILALLGQPQSEAITDPKKRLAEVHRRRMGAEKVTRAEKVTIVREADLARLPDDARSLRRWVERARECSRAASRLPS